MFFKRAWEAPLLAAAILAGVSAFWVFDALPYQDLPAHAGAIALRARYASSAFEQRYYALGTELGPYSFFLLAGDALGRLFGPEAAVRALASLPVLATPLALVWARRRLHRDRSLWAGLLGVALSFGFMTLLGLSSYLLGLALLVVALAEWIDLVSGDSREPRREVAVSALALAVFFAHGFAFVVLGALAALTALASPSPTRNLLRLRTFAPGLLLGAWSAARGGPPAASAGTFQLVRAADFQTPLDKLSLLLTPTLMTRWGVDAAFGVLVWAVLIAALFAARRFGAAAAPGEDPASAARARAAAVAAGGAAGLFVVLPHALEWFGFIDGRMVPVVLFSLVLAVRRPALGPRLGRALAIVSVASACGTTAILLVASARFQSEARGCRDVLAAIPARATLLNLPIDPDSAIFTAHPFVHYDKLASVERDVLVSDVWADRATALYATPDNPQARLPAAYNSANLHGRIDWASFALGDWSHVLVRTRPDAPTPTTPAGLTLAAHAGGFWLYANTAH